MPWPLLFVGTVREEPTMRRFGLSFIALLLLATPVSFASTAGPAQLWVAWPEGRSLDAAWESGAVVLDRFPDALVVADASSPLGSGSKVPSRWARGRRRRSCTPRRRDRARRSTPRRSPRAA
jgi:hypothetical protein